ncbi:hypothetical protein CRYUN_Cryun09bG0116400 [Craigia yunnanensis]
MVQRKVPNKLGIQADHIKSEKRLGTLKPSAYHHQDGKNKGTDLKKKMKKSRSIKLSDIEGPRSSPLRKTVAQPGKPPPLNIQAAAVTPQKKSMIKTMDGSPNYMKSTSSSEAKKESSQVRFRSTQTVSDSKNLRRRSSTGSKISYGSCNKPARTLTRTSSLMLVRTLTKSPSFKPARASAKKCSRVALCTDMNVQRATCSATLKDSKFPAYLMLNPGGTESEGTSIIKVCPYTYCSLNGHHHTPLPPLKCFLKERRRSLKTQRSMKMEDLSLRRQKPSGDGTEEFDEEHVVFGDEPASKGVDLGMIKPSPMSPLTQGRPLDFFIEIYAKGKGNDAEATRGSTQMNAKEMDESGCGNETAPEHDTDKPVSESLSEGSPQSEIDFDENLEHCGEIISKVDITETLREELKHNDADEEFRGILVKEESLPWDLNDGDEQEWISTVDVDHTMFEVIDMEWEEWGISTLEPGDEAHSSIESDLNIGDSSEGDRNNLHDEFVISSDESDSKIAEEILVDGAEQQVFEEDTACIDTCSQVSETLCYEQVSSTEEMFEVLVAMEEEEEEENTEIDFIGIVATPSSTEELDEEPIPGKEKMQKNGVPGTVNEVSEADSPLEIPENSCTIDFKDEALESTEQFQLHSFDKLEQDETNEDYNIIQEPGDSEADQKVTMCDFCPEKEVPSGEAGDKMEAGKVADAELLIGIQISDSSHVLSGASEDVNEVEDNQNNQLCEDNNAIDDNFSSQYAVDESLFAESRDHLSDGQHENTNVVDNQSVLEKDQDGAKFKFPTSMDSEEQNSSRMHKTSLAEGIEEVGKMELEENATPGLDVAETSPAASDKTSHKPRSAFSFTRSSAEEELPDNHNRKWTIGRKRYEENYEESRKFNPREPNFLPVVPEPDAEKVDLRHQMMNERKNAEEWMLDHALQQAVTKLAPVRKRKVALLVEAFETVLPITKCETHLSTPSTGFAHGRPIQACN